MSTDVQIIVQDIDIEEATNWCEKEFTDINLGDKRLDKRLMDITVKLMAQPLAPINQACDDWADTKASYRLFKNEKVTVEEILNPHQRRTQERMKNYPIVLAVQDTSFLNYTSHPKTKGLGPIGAKEQNLLGLVMHTTMALTPAGLPLGILSQDIWARDAEAEPMTPAELRKRPIEEKESYKWLQSLQQTVNLTPEGVQMVSVCDREADIYELFIEATNLKTGLLVRATHDRVLMKQELGKLRACVEAASIAGHLKVHVPARDGEPERDAIVAVQHCPVTLTPPWRPKRADQAPLSEVTLDAVLVQEVDSPTGVTPLEWLLLTNVPVVTFEDAVERVKWYRARWHIEVYFKVLKSGCNVEKCRLGTAQRLIRFLALSSIVAWRLYWITHINRHTPDALCTLVLTDHEWRALYAIIHKTTIAPQQTPTVRQAVRWIAQLGGFLGRKGDGEPGVTVIWRGWHRLQDVAATWLLFYNKSYG
jgi:hypothetical protein